MDEYIYPAINPERKRRFFRYLVLESKLQSKIKSKEQRGEFVKKIDVLRSVSDVGELKKQKEPAPRSEKEIEAKINKVMKQEKIIRELQLEHKGLVENISDIRGLIKKIEEDHQTILALQDTIKILDRQLKESPNKRQLAQLNRRVKDLEDELNRAQIEKQKLTAHEKIVEQKVIEKPVDVDKLHKRRELLLKKIDKLKKKK
ncbi:hypothetical protein KY316_00280 [Candidatus Woesearchaeota archaeon]|nr:hypothetical protein [Candidatus Woesearchaeota archaeon]